ncbi:MAG: hypothetical protein O6852_03650 [Gammaproteobacteria bacterium]|nr:hypothetical protein [Gammaproteobacteria bacterium]
MKKKLPPFGKRLKERMRKGFYSTNGVNIYTSWNMGRPYSHCITFPPEASPDDYDWSFLTGQEISLINTNGNADYESLKELAVLLVKSGVKSVGLIDVEYPLQCFVPKVKGIAA